MTEGHRISRNRFDLRQETNGTWTVYDIFTGLFVTVEQRDLIGLDIADADDMVVHLNRQYNLDRDART